MFEPVFCHIDHWGPKKAYSWTKECLSTNLKDVRTKSRSSTTGYWMAQHKSFQTIATICFSVYHIQNLILRTKVELIQKVTKKKYTSTLGACEYPLAQLLPAPPPCCDTYIFSTLNRLLWSEFLIPFITRGSRSNNCENESKKKLSRRRFKTVLTRARGI